MWFANMFINQLLFRRQGAAFSWVVDVGKHRNAMNICVVLLRMVSEITETRVVFWAVRPFRSVAVPYLV